MAPLSETLHFARQPIVDRTGRTLGYEVLFRSDGAASDAVFTDGAAATRSVLTALSLEPDSSPRNLPVFVNLPVGLISDPAVKALDPRRIGFEILEDVVATVETVKAVAELRLAGFTVALDDFRPDPGRLDFLAHADIVKVDVQETGCDAVAAIIELVRQTPALLLAEKVETPAELERCVSLGFDLFQGYAVGVPIRMSAMSTRGSNVTRLQPVRRMRTLLGRRAAVEPFRP